MRQRPLTRRVGLTVPNLTLENLTLAELLAMADGFLRQGNLRRAAELYALASPLPDPNRQDILVRRGIATHPVATTGMILQVLDALAAVPQSAFVSDGLATWNKILPFLEDPRFVEISDRHSDLLPIPNWHWNLQTVLWAAQQASRVEGDFVELGVFRGHTSLFVAEYLGFAAMQRVWRLYDTFSGIPADQLDPGWTAKNKAAYAGTFSREEVRERFAHIPNIRVIAGRVPEILLEDGPDRIAFLHVDLNNSAAEIAALDLLFDQISSGGVIVFDDYCWLAARAQHDAEMRWFSERNLHILPLPTGQGVFVKS